MITSVRLIQVGNNRNNYFRYFLGVRFSRGVRLIKVSFKVNKGNKFWDFGYCPLNRGCPLNTGFTVLAAGELLKDFVLILAKVFMLVYLSCLHYLRTFNYLHTS